jgi:hypothetical protein
MKKGAKHYCINAYLLCGLSLLLSVSTLAQEKPAENADPLVTIGKAFRSPPNSARPWVYWMWMSSNVTRKGITADLESMKRVGIGGVLIMDVGLGMPLPGGMKFMDDNWKAMFLFAVQEAKRLGIEVDMNNAQGWSGSGGPWITPEYGMQTVVSSETPVNGGTVDVNLPQPPTKGDYYRDIAVLAVKDAPLELQYMDHPLLTATTYMGTANYALPTVQNPLKLYLPGTGNFTQKYPSLTLRFNSPFTACVLNFATDGQVEGWFEAVLQVSDDGIHFRNVKNFSLETPTYYEKRAEVSLNFDLQTARWYRVQFLKAHGNQAAINVTHIDINSRYKVHELARKSLADLVWNKDLQSAPISETAPDGVSIPKENVIDVSRYMDSLGRLKWLAPPGKWTIQRFGHTFTGEAAYGPECDKLSKEGIDRSFNGMIAQLVKLAGPGAKNTLTTTHIDSWEVGAQNWTKNMPEEFRKRRGYDIVPFLPVLNGRIIGNLQYTERFLWDLRKTISELLVENYVAEMQRLCHEHGLLFSYESYTTPGNDLDEANYADIPSGEFWTRYGSDVYEQLKAMSSAAHLNNRPITAAESFTSRENEKWLLHPAAIKALGDSSFCDGINRFVIHNFTAQPWLNQTPGLGLFAYGLHYTRTQTWWEYSLPWHKYLARCQYLLRQGVFVADVLNLQPEEPLYHFKKLALTGYDYDACSPDAFQRFKVEDGNLVNGSGNKYRLLVLTHTGTMTEPMLRRIRDMVVDGASVLGDPPMATPGLSDYPAADEKLKALVRELWGDGTEQERSVGKGHVYYQLSPEEVLKRMNIPPDFVSNNGLHYIHHNLNGSDVYFIANSLDSTIITNCTFRAGGKRPVWWDAETGEQKALTAYTVTADGTVHVPLVLGPTKSGFMVFSPGKSIDKQRIVKVTRNGETILQDGIAADITITNTNHTNAIPFLNGNLPIAGNYVFTKADGTQFMVSNPEKVISVGGPWKLVFPAAGVAPDKNEIQLDELKSWTELPGKQLNYFSGTATYFNTLTIPGDMIKSGNKIIIDLGKVSIMAKVFVNGKEAGILWKTPFAADITSLVHKGANSLEIEVVNLLVNRQIGDEFLPEDSKRTNYGSFSILSEWPEFVLKDTASPTGRHTFTPWRIWKKDDALQESGLLGPVVVQQVMKIQ